MKKRILSMLLVLAMILSLSAAVWAESYTGGSSWSVTLNAKGKFESNLPAIGSEISTMQPGDDLTLTVKLNNKNKDSADWYIQNSIIKSLEEDAATSGGAYSYKLSYVTSTGNSRVLYDSELLGGELDNNAPDEVKEYKGLKEVNLALGNKEDNRFIYLESMASGGTGTVTLWVKLEGESQGNAYKGANAQLMLRFAAELTQTKVIVKTGDETNVMPYVLGMGVSGVLILLLAVDGVVQRKKKQRGENA